MNWYLKVLKQYGDFRRRSRRKEYWMFALFNAIFTIIAIVLDNSLGIAIERLGYGPIYGLYAIVLLVPGLSVSIRRLHDIGKSGWMLLLLLIPIVGAIWLLVLMAINSSPENKYGLNPKEAVA